MKHVMRAEPQVRALVAEGAFTTAEDERVEEQDDERIEAKRVAKKAAEDEMKIVSSTRGASGFSELPPEPGIIRRGGVRTLAYDITERMLLEERGVEIATSEQGSEEPQGNLCDKCGKSVTQSGPSSTDRCSCPKMDETDVMGSQWERTNMMIQSLYRMQARTRSREH